MAGMAGAHLRAVASCAAHCLVQGAVADGRRPGLNVFCECPRACSRVHAIQRLRRLEGFEAVRPTSTPCGQAGSMPPATAVGMVRGQAAGDVHQTGVVGPHVVGPRAVGPCASTSGHVNGSMLHVHGSAPACLLEAGLGGGGRFEICCTCIAGSSLCRLSLQWRCSLSRLYDDASGCPMFGFRAKLGSACTEAT